MMMGLLFVCWMKMTIDFSFGVEFGADHFLVLRRAFFLESWLHDPSDCHSHPADRKFKIRSYE